MSTTEFAITTLVFTIHENEFRTSKINRITIDASGTYYVLVIDGKNVEKSKNEIDRTKEGLYNKLVDRFTARQNK